MFDVGHQPVVQFVALREHLKGLDPGADHGRGQRVREKVGTRTLAQHVDDLPAAGGESAYGASECLAERTREDVHLPAQVVEFGDAAARFAQHARRMALVDHHQRVVLFRQSADPIERCGVAVHREYAVGDDDAEPLGLRLLQALLQFAHVGIGVAVTHGLAQTHAVDDRSMVQRIGDDGVLLRKERFEHAAVGVEAGGVENRVLRTEIVGDNLLQLLVDVLAAADEAHRRHAVAAGIHCFLRRLDQPRIVRQSEVIVGTEVEHLPTCNLDLGPLGRSDDPFPFVKPCGLDFGEFMLQVLLDFPVHIR